MTSRLTARLREIVRPAHAPPPAGAGAGPVAAAGPRSPELEGAAAARPSSGARLAEAAARAFGGDVIETPLGPCVQVDRVYEPDHRHGLLRVGDCAGHTSVSGTAFPLLAGAGFDDERGGAIDALFVDLETTGLAGGAGTYAFLVGCAWFEEEAFRVRQYLMAGHACERAQLAAVRAPFDACRALVTYNGRSFDVPVLETRYLYHREAPPTTARAHLDMLHVARRLWRSVRGPVPAPGLQSESCTLGTLERVLFGVRRTGDVPGFEIPGRYFAFLRSADAEPLGPVLQHNRLDLVSLAAVTARALRLVDGAPEASDQPRECYGLGRLFERVGLTERAEACYERAAAVAGKSWHPEDEIVRAESLRGLALLRRRAGRHADAALCCDASTHIRRCPAGLMREALEALAIHHEHRSRDLELARTFALRSRRMGDTDAIGHRLQRLDRKRARQASGPESLWN